MTASTLHCPAICIQCLSLRTELQVVRIENTSNVATKNITWLTSRQWERRDCLQIVPSTEYCTQHTCTTINYKLLHLHWKTFVLSLHISYSIIQQPTTNQRKTVEVPVDTVEKWLTRSFSLAILFQFRYSASTARFKDAFCSRGTLIDVKKSASGAGKQAIVWLDQLWGVCFTMDVRMSWKLVPLSNPTHPWLHNDFA